MAFTQNVYKLDHSVSHEDVVEVARAIVGDRFAEVSEDWSHDLIDAVSFGVGTLSLARVSGPAIVGGESKHWSTVLKILDCSPVDRPIHTGTPVREIAAYRSLLFDEPSAGFRAAKTWSISEKADGIVWLWTEDLSTNHSQVHSPFQYLAAAEVIGKFQGSMLRANVGTEKWMNRNAAVSRWTNPQTMEFCTAVESHAENRFVRTALPGPIFDRVLGFRADILLLAEVSKLLPKTLSHGDFHARNLFAGVGADGKPEIVAIDLASVGIEPIGNDAGTLVGSSLSWGDEEADQVMVIESEIFDGYVDGLRSEGCEIPTDLIRLGYLITLCGYARGVANIPSVIANELPVGEAMLMRYGGEAALLPYSYRRRVEFAVTVFDEAVELANRLLKTHRGTEHPRLVD